MRVDGHDLWALTGNSFELIKLDPVTLERRDAVWLGAPIRVNETTLEPNVADDLSDLDLDGWPAFFSRGGDVYIEGKASVYRFDGTNGARIGSYDMTAEGGLSTFDVLGDTLYLHPADYSRREVFEFDADAGKVVQSIPSQSENIGAAIVR